MLEIKNISYIVNENGKEKVILDNISFDVKDNENFVITGHNGSGKSTLLKIIMGVIKATGGSIIFNGKDITNLSINERAKLGLAYAFQTPVCFKGLTVKRMLEIACGEEKPFDYYCDILSKLGLCARDYMDREVGVKLSGGEQKRIEIASVIARKANLNLFDEPEAGIDIWSFDSLLDIFSKNKASNIIVSHQQKLIEKADRVLILNNGKIEKIGNVNEIMENLNTNTACQKLRGNK